MFKGLGNLGALMQQAQEMGQKMQEVEAQLRARRFSGSSGGGMVEAEVSGAGDVTRLAIDPQLTEHNEREMLEDLIPAAINQAMEKMREARAQAAQAAMPGADIPGVQEILKGLLQRD